MRETDAHPHSTAWRMGDRVAGEIRPRCSPRSWRRNAEVTIANRAYRVRISPISDREMASWLFSIEERDFHRVSDGDISDTFPAES